jgi:hypothetical protein
MLIAKVIKKEFKKGGIHILVTMAVMAVSLLIDMGAYSSNEWKEYKEYNKARTEVYDYNQMPQYEKYSDFYENIGISAEEYTAFIEYDLAVVDHDTGTFLAMAEKYQSIIKEWNQFSNPVKRAMKTAFLAFMDNLKTIRGFSAVIFLFAGFVIAVIECSKKKKVLTENLIQIVVTAVYFVAFIAVFGALNRLPERILFGTNILAVFSGLDVLFRFFKTEKAKTGICRIILYYVFLGVALGIFGLIFVNGLFEQNSEKEKVYEESFDKLEAAARKIEADDESVYFLEAALYKSMGGEIGKCKEPANAIKTADWLYNSPLMKKRYERIGITGILDNSSGKKIYMIVPEDSDTEYLEKIFEEHEAEISIITIDDFIQD